MGPFLDIKYTENSSEEDLLVRDLCTPRSLQRWYEPVPLEGLSPS